VHSLGGGWASLSLHASLREVELAAQLTVEHGFGAILVASPDVRRKQREEKLLDAAAAYTAITGIAAGVDANYYSGSSRRPGDAELSLSWIRMQHNAGVSIPQTDPGFVAADRFDQLVSLLDQSAAIQQSVSYPVRAVLPLDFTYLSKHHAILIDEIRKRELHEVSLLLGHPKDPFGVQKTAKGVLEVLELGNVGVHRTDLSAIPCLASGASSASIGTGTSLRHVFTGSAGGYVPTGSPSVIVPHTMAYRLQDRLNDYVSRFPDDIFWDCRCDNCYGRRVDIAVRTADHVIAHNYNLIAEIADAVIGPTGGGMSTWFARSQSAQFRIEELAAETQLRWEAPAYLGAWLSTQRSTVGA
jgi:hypothetical protein